MNYKSMASLLYGSSYEQLIHFLNGKLFHTYYKNMASLLYGSSYELLTYNLYKKFFLCRIKSDLLLNNFWHISHEYGFSPVWILLWIVNSLKVRKAFSQELQEYGFSPVWILLWTVKSLLVRKDFSHILQEYGFSPVWVLLW